MRERRDIVALWHQVDSAVLATLVAVQGSSYRRPGARLLIASDGRYAGAISGGCLEAELIRKARWSTRRGATVQRFSTEFDDTADIPYGLGCGGTVDVLLEPSGTPEFEAILHALEDSLNGHAQTVHTWLPRNGAPLRRSVNASPVQANGDAPQPEGILIEETLPPPQRVVLCGAGDDARPLVSLVSLMGWDSVVLDGRAQWARSERFPEAQQVIVSHARHISVRPSQGPTARSIPAWGGAERVAPGTGPEEEKRAEGPLYRSEGSARLFENRSGNVSFSLRSSDAVVVMTHSYEQDRDWLIAALSVGPRYLGLLGSRHRSALLIGESAVKLHWPVERVCQHLFAPIGLDLGGDGAESIALAILSEIQARLAGKLGASQRMTAELVAEQIAKGGASRYLQTQCAL